MLRPPSTLSSIRWGLVATLVVALAYAGCSSDDETGGQTNTTTSSNVGGAGAGSPCEGNGPDGICVVNGPAAEPCECPDCTMAARCTDGCVDDGVCRNDVDNGETEDCSCDDCYFNVPSCGPGDEGCDDEVGCQFDENCTCPDCTDTPFCQDNCVDNGHCVPWLEGCSCADCAQDEDCTGSSSSSGTGGSGGGGGSSSSSGTGGSGGSSSSSGTGGSGGAGGG